jgi:7-cyano-7-deazaguanine synthase in queuosine biosynthesis
MAQRPAVILASGGIRSLVTTAVVLSVAEKTKLILLHIKDARPNAPVRLDYVHRQAEHFGVHELIELELPHLKPEEFTIDTGGTPPPPLVRPQILLVALAQAMEIGAGRLIWPVQVNGDYDTIARVTEQMVLLQHLAQLEHPTLPTVETPLLELSDAQMIQLGGQLDVPWPMAWTCTMRGDQPCRICEACRRRRMAFEAAGMIDPIEKPVPAR